jgi:AcrR family transcriptional regulator
MSTELVRRPGRPRSEKARKAILTATLELAADGPQALTMEAIAKRAAVSKETLYRWWPSKTDVVLEALAHYGDEAIPVPDGGSLVGDLRAFLRATAAALDPRTRRLLRSLAAAAATDARVAGQVRDQFLAARRAALAEVLENAVQRGELGAGRVATVLDLVFGSLWYRLIFDIGPLDEAWAEAVTDAIGPATPHGGFS